LTLLIIAIQVEVVGEQNRVRQISQGKSRVCSRQLLVNDHRGGRIEPGAAKAFIDGDTEESKLTQFSEKWFVEAFLGILLKGLWTHSILGELTDRFANFLVFFAGIEEIGHGHLLNGRCLGGNPYAAQAEGA
jgi:hypothetical protein